MERINKLYEQRRNYSKTYMHKASRQIIEYGVKIDFGHESVEMV